MAQIRSSSIPYVKARLAAASTPLFDDPAPGLFRTALATAGEAPNQGGQIAVYYGDPGSGYEQECVIVGGTAAPSAREWALLGDRPSKVEETYRLAVDILVVRTESQQTATERAFAILALLDAAVRGSSPGSLSLGLANPNADIYFEHLQAHIAEPHLREMNGGENGYLAHVEWALIIQARI